MEFKAGAGLSQADVDGISAIFITYFQPTGYSMIERVQIDKVISEQGFQRSSLTQSQMVRIGMILNVSIIVIGDINVVLGQYNVDARVINVESGVVIATEGATFATNSSVRSSMQGIAQRLASKIATEHNPSTSSSSSSQKSIPGKRDKIEVLYGYLKVFPKEIGEFSSVPVNVIKNINAQGQYGFNNWRIPTSEELSLLRANNLIGLGKYMTNDSTNGRVILVTDGESISTLEEKKELEYKNGVDLGLSVKWAPCNVGASNPEDYGDYYAWGVTDSSHNDSWSNYKWYDGTQDVLTKYNTKKWCGTVDNITIIAPEDDIAYLQFGGKWRIPTEDEWTELMTRCQWRWTTQNGIKGEMVTGPNGNSIFLPAAGCWLDGSPYNFGAYGYYWSSTLNSETPNYAKGVGFFFSTVTKRSDNRYEVYSIRPVSEY